MNFKDLGGLSKPLTKLIDVCSSGMGKILEPKQIRSKADAKVYEIEAVTKALLESQKTLGCNTTYENGEVKFIVDKSETEKIEEVEVLEKTALVQSVPTQIEGTKENTSTEIEMFHHDMNERLYYKNIKKEKNIYNTLNFTMNELEDVADAEVSDEQVDEDWITRFFNTVEDVNNEKLQALWGRILAGEIKQPNTYSLRTLELLRNLSIKEAELFSKVANFVIQNSDKTKAFFLLAAESKFDISFQEIVALQDLDLIHPNQLGFESSPMNVESIDSLYLGKEYILIKVPKNAKYSLSIYLLTSIGAELLNLVERELNTEYIKELSLQIKSKNKEIKVFSNSSPDEKGNYLITNNIEI